MQSLSLRGDPWTPRIQQPTFVWSELLPLRNLPGLVTEQVQNLPGCVERCGCRGSALARRDCADSLSAGAHLMHMNLTCAII